MRRASYLTAIGVLAGAGVVFALAIRGDRRGAVVVDPVEADRAAARAQAEAARAQVEAERARVEADRAKTRILILDAAGLAQQLAGPRPGQPGPIFDALTFGSGGIAADRDAIVRIQNEVDRAGAKAAVEEDELVVTVPSEVADRIVRTWGDPPRDRDLYDGGSHAALHVRDDRDGVIFHWRPYETLVHLVDPGDGGPAGGTPFSIVGARLDDLPPVLREHLAATAGDAAEPAYAWTLPPLADATPVRADVFVDHGVITRVTVSIDVPPDDVAAALRKVYGDAGALHLGPWKHGALTVTIHGHPPDSATVTATR